MKGKAKEIILVSIIATVTAVTYIQTHKPVRAAVVLGVLSLLRVFIQKEGLGVLVNIMKGKSSRESKNMSDGTKGEENK